MQKRIDLRRQGIEPLQQNLPRGAGLRLSNQIEQILNLMEQEERTLLEQRSKFTQRSTDYSLNGILYGIPIYSLLLGAIGLLLARNISRP